MNSTKTISQANEDGEGREAGRGGSCVTEDSALGTGTSFHVLIKAPEVQPKLLETTEGRWLMLPRGFQKGS